MKGMEKPVAKNPAIFIAKTGLDFEMVNGIFLKSQNVVSDRSKQKTHVLGPSG